MFGRNYLRISMLVLGVFLVAAATAFGDNVRNLSLPGNIVLQGTRLQAGEYTMTWYHHSPRLTVKVSNEKKVLVTASATLVDQKKTYERDTLMVTTKPDGTRTLRAIGLAGSSQAIVFDVEAQQGSETWFMSPYSSNSARRPMAQ